MLPAMVNKDGLKFVEVLREFETVFKDFKMLNRSDTDYILIANAAHRAHIRVGQVAAILKNAAYVHKGIPHNVKIPFMEDGRFIASSSAAIDLASHSLKKHIAAMRNYINKVNGVNSVVPPPQINVPQLLGKIAVGIIQEMRR